ncbi:MAG: hypothetical protein KC649_04970, partial [Candidatus Omnitrophica bacterium]|nr:hypothetical protein [Candidatus Omnitrophota bacterium]
SDAKHRQLLAQSKVDPSIRAKNIEDQISVSHLANAQMTDEQLTQEAQANLRRSLEEMKLPFDERVAVEKSDRMVQAKAIQRVSNETLEIMAANAAKKIEIASSISPQERAEVMVRARSVRIAAESKLTNDELTQDVQNKHRSGLERSQLDLDGRAIIIANEIRTTALAEAQLTSTELRQIVLDEMAAQIGGYEGTIEEASQALYESMVKNIQNETKQTKEEIKQRIQGDFVRSLENVKQPSEQQVEAKLRSIRAEHALSVNMERKTRLTDDNKIQRDVTLFTDGATEDDRGEAVGTITYDVNGKLIATEGIKNFEVFTMGGRKASLVVWADKASGELTRVTLDVDASGKPLKSAVITRGGQLHEMDFAGSYRFEINWNGSLELRGSLSGDPAKDNQTSKPEGEMWSQDNKFKLGDGAIVKLSGSGLWVEKASLTISADGYLDVSGGVRRVAAPEADESGEQSNESPDKKSDPRAITVTTRDGKTVFTNGTVDIENNEVVVTEKQMYIFDGMKTTELKVQLASGLLVTAAKGMSGKKYISNIAVDDPSGRILAKFTTSDFMNAWTQYNGDDAENVYKHLMGRSDVSAERKAKITQYYNEMKSSKETHFGKKTAEFFNKVDELGGMTWTSTSYSSYPGVYSGSTTHYLSFEDIILRQVSMDDDDISVTTVSLREAEDGMQFRDAQKVANAETILRIAQKIDPKEVNVYEMTTEKIAASFESVAKGAWYDWYDSENEANAKKEIQKIVKRFRAGEISFAQMYDDASNVSYTYEVQVADSQFCGGEVSCTYN